MLKESFAQKIILENLECRLESKNKAVLQVVVLLLVLSLCSVEGMRKQKKNRPQGRRGDKILNGNLGKFTNK